MAALPPTRNNDNGANGRHAVGGESWADIDRVVDTALEKATAFYFGINIKYPASKYLMDLKVICYRIRLYAISEKEELNEIWEEMRDKYLYMEFVVFVMMEITMRCSTTWDEFAVTLAEAHQAVWGGVDKELSATDQAMVSSVVKSERLYDILAANPWFITLILISRSEYFVKIYKGATETPLQ